MAVALFAGCALFWKQHREAVASNVERSRVAEDLQVVSNRWAAAEARIPELRRALELAGADRSVSLVELARLGRSESSPTPDDPESRWNRPPEALPEWNPESPYVWIDKSVLPKFQVAAFQPDGSLSPGVAEVLTLTPKEHGELDRELSSVVAEYRREERAHARLVDEHLPEIAKKDGRKITLRIDPMPEVTAALRARFEGALSRTLGEQRSRILVQSASGWISQMFPAAEGNSRIVSIALEANGDHHIATRNGVGTMSASGPGEYIEYVPEHLRPLLDEFRAATGQAEAK